MASFRNAGKGLIGARFEPDEVRVLEGLVGEMAGVLDASTDPSDPVTKRLFPAAYEEPEDQRAYEELVGDQLKSQKLAALTQVKNSLPSDHSEEVVLDPDALEAWLTVLNDIRLAIGTRLDVTEEVMGQELDPDEPEAPAMAVLHWLGWVQESFLRELNG